LLRNIECRNNQLTSLDVSSNTLLESIDCGHNHLVSLDLSKNHNFQDSFYADNNQLTSILISDSVKVWGKMHLENNQLDSISFFGPHKDSIIVEAVYLTNNNITSLDLRKVNFERLYCDSNQLNSLDIRNGNNSNITNIYAYDNPNLSCISVDDTSYSNANWIGNNDFQFDQQVNFSDDCASFVLGPTASFSASPTTVCLGDTISFTDTSSGNPTSWSWDFGDGNSSTAQNPTHVYTTSELMM